MLATYSIPSEKIYKIVTRPAKEPCYKSYHTRIPYYSRPMSRISADIKWMPLSNQGFNYFQFNIFND